MPLWKTRSTGAFGLVSSLFRGLQARHLVHEISRWRSRPIRPLDHKANLHEKNLPVREVRPNQRDDSLLQSYKAIVSHGP